eukprot:8660403-Pyramimonas_sp.AAC.1
MRRQPASSSSFESLLSNSPPPSNTARSSGPNFVFHTYRSLAHTTEGCLEVSAPYDVNLGARSTASRKTSWLPALSARVSTSTLIGSFKSLLILILLRKCGRGR